MLKLHDLFFLLRQQLINLLNHAIGQVLHLLGALAHLVFGDGLGLLVLFECFVRVAAMVPDGHAALLRHFVHDLDQLLAPLFCQ